MKISVPLVNQLIWPGAVNAAVPMKVKAWSPAHRVVGVHVGEVEELAFRTIEVGDDVRVVRVASATVDQPCKVSNPRPPTMTLTPSLPVTKLSNSLPIRLIAAVVVWSA